MEKTLVALLTGGGMAALALMVQQVMQSSTTRKANEIASEKLQMEKQDLLGKQEAGRRAELAAEADRYRRLLKEEEEQHEETRHDLEAMRLNCRKCGDLCQIEIRTKDKTGQE